MTILKEVEYNAWFRKKLLMMFGLIVVSVAVVEIWAVNRLATFGSEISRLEMAKASLALENSILEKQIADKSSLLEVSKSSKGLGFVKVSKLEYLTPHNIALNH
jgi:hypothetical protein